MRSIATKFLMPVVALAALFTALSVYQGYKDIKRETAELMDREAAMVMAFDQAIRSYVADEIRPAMEERVAPGEFFPETMSTSFVARSIFEKVRRDFPDYTIKFSSDDPRNPANQAGPEELRMIQYFNDHPEVKKWSGVIDLAGRPHIAHFNARRMKERCLRCHGNPEDAPASLVERYGTTAGFHRPVGEVIALDTVAIPIDKVQGPSWRKRPTMSSSLRWASGRWSPLSPWFSAWSCRAGWPRCGRTLSVSPATAELLAEVEAAVEDADLEYLREELPKAIEQSLDGVERVTKIVRSMKDFSHPGDSDKQPADINKAIESTITVSRNEWKYVAEMAMDLDLSLPLVPCLLGDINQVVLNMIVNAAHAIADVVCEGSGEKGTITISTRRDGDWAEIRISDTGAGMPAEVRAKVLDPFFTTKEVGRGTGQGLAIAHSVVVQTHGGTIDVESQVGRGTTFIIRLPIEGKANKRAETREQEAAHPIC